MKRILFSVAALLIVMLMLPSCSSNTYAVAHYETRDRMEDDVGFSVRGVPTLDDIVIYGSMDKKLAEIVYNISEGSKGASTLTFRVADGNYAEKFSETTGSFGTSLIKGASPTGNEKLGSSQVEYLISENSVAAVFTFNGLSYSLTLKFIDPEVTPSYDDVRQYVLAVISTK